MVYTAQTYYDAARLHLAGAGRLLDEGEFFWAHYVAGVAVECILRAHGTKADSEFTGRHDLMKLAEKAAFLALPCDAKYDDYRSDLAEINQRWRSEQRFMEESQLERYLNDLSYDKIKGSRIKYSSRRMYELMYELATRIVGLGVVKWNNLPKK